ncbi:MAG: bifunctional helix-turn-helix transcriptional regulator/GNAT family N-acetyltransferase [Rickettsiales bacterium]
MTINQTQIEATRAFNRYYTQTIGALGDRYLNGPHSLTELRILHELYKTPDLTATQLGKRLDIDHGFLSRKLSGLTRKQLVKRTRSTTDKRHVHLSLTAKATKQQPRLEQAADTQVANMLAPISEEKRSKLIGAMHTIRSILRNNPPAPIMFRQLKPGDGSWIVHRHATVIAKEFGWNIEFEAMCLQIMADFIKNYRPEDERSWVVERDGDILGSLFLIRENESTARLRLLYVEAAARGLGLATKLLEKSIQFARDKGYKKITLFTTSSNVAARRIYTKLGMILAKEEPFEFASQSQNGEHWELIL